jgi:hypothetical protein
MAPRPKSASSQESWPGRAARALFLRLENSLSITLKQAFTGWRKLEMAGISREDLAETLWLGKIRCFRIRRLLSFLPNVQWQKAVCAKGRQRRKKFRFEALVGV